MNIIDAFFERAETEGFLMIYGEIAINYSDIATLILTFTTIILAIIAILISILGMMGYTAIRSWISTEVRIQVDRRFQTIRDKNDQQASFLSDVSTDDIVNLDQEEV